MKSSYKMTTTEQELMNIPELDFDLELDLDNESIFFDDNTKTIERIDTNVASIANSNKDMELKITDMQKEINSLKKEITGLIDILYQVANKGNNKKRKMDD
jgi:septal ring factor EnvC (AmiA/AmiB activator)